MPQSATPCITTWHPSPLTHLKPQPLTQSSAGLPAPVNNHPPFQSHPHFLPHATSRRFQTIHHDLCVPRLQHGKQLRQASIAGLCGLSGLITYHHPHRQATADTVKLGDPHEPKEEAINVFKQIEHELKRALVRQRYESNSEPRLSLARQVQPTCPPKQACSLSLGFG